MNAGAGTGKGDPGSPAIIDLSRRGAPLLMAFGGIAATLPPFEFIRITRDLGVNTIYLRDFSRSWYHAGLPGISAGIEATASFLSARIAESGADRVVLFGNSMGGYAALVFGVLLKAQVVHAFSPHTSIADESLVRHREELRSVHRNFPDTYFDLGRTIGLHPEGDFHVHYDSGDRLDTRHAMHLKGCRNVTLHPYDVGGGHALVKTLRESGDLRRIIITACGGRPAGPPDAGGAKRRSLLARLFGRR